MLAWDTQPTAKGEADTGDIERSENDFVVLGQPFREKDVEVGPPIAGVAGGDRGKWTAHAVERQNRDLHQDNGS